MKQANNTNSVFNRLSRYVHGATTEVGGGRLEWAERVTFPTDETDLAYVVEKQFEGRPDMIASLFYNEPRYWWVIANHNNILDPFSELAAGQIIYLPTKARLMTMLNGKIGGVDSRRETTPIVPPIVI